MKSENYWKYDENPASNNSVVAKTENAIVFQNNDHEKITPTFGNISVTNATDIHFGNKTFYQGPVTIQHFVYGDNNDQTVLPSSNIKEKSYDKNGIDNPGCDEKEFEVPASREENFRKSDEIPNGRWKNFIFKRSTNIATVFILLVLIFSTTFFIVSKLKKNNFNVEKNLTSTYYDEEEHNTPIKGPIDPVVSLKPLKLKIVSRLEWLAQPPINGVNNLITPVPYVIISHTATENCSSQAQCIFQVRTIQTYHMESRGWSDIGYNFLIGGDGEVYFGRGWDKEGAHTFGYNSRSIGISFIGTFIETKPPFYQLIACKKLIAKGVELGYVQKNYQLFGARQLQTTQSPGDALFKEIQTWPQWTAESP